MRCPKCGNSAVFEARFEEVRQVTLGVMADLFSEGENLGYETIDYDDEEPIDLCFVPSDTGVQCKRETCSFRGHPSAFDDGVLPHAIGVYRFRSMDKKLKRKA